MPESTSSPSLVRTVSGYAWLVVILLWPVAMLNYLDRQTLSVMRASILADIPSIANDEQFGMLMAVFMWVYAGLSPLGGYVGDRFSRRWTVILSLFVWSAVTFATGQATTYDQMYWARATMGISEAFYIPAALAMIAGFHPGRTQSRAIGIHQTGIYAGLALGGISGYIAQTSSWRNAFSWFGAAGMIYALVLMIALRDPNANDQHIQRTEKPRLVDTIRSLFGSFSFWVLVVYFTLPALGGWLMKNWLPTYLRETFELDEGSAGLSATLYITIASLVGALLGGMLADGWMRRTDRGRIFASALGMLATLPALLALGQAGSLTAAIVWLILYGLGWGFFDANNMPILSQIVRPEHRATGYGIMNMVSIGAGGAFTVALGKMRDNGVPIASAFMLLAGLALASAVIVLLIRPARR